MEKGIPNSCWILNRVIFGVLFVLVVQLNAYDSIAQECSQLVWSKEYQLQWEDFMGVPDSTILLYETLPDALSVVFIEVVIDSLNNYKALAKFDQCKSWVSIRTDMILNHERGHFNITELFARNLQSVLDKNQDDYEYNIDSLYHEIYLMCEESHRLYDSKTLFGTRDVRQKVWSDSLLFKLGCN